MPRRWPGARMSTNPQATSAIKSPVLCVHPLQAAAEAQQRTHVVGLIVPAAGPCTVAPVVS